MKKIKMLCAVAVSLLSIAVYAETKAPEVVIYTQDKPVAIISADQPEFVIKLKSNPTTGYSWFLRDYDGQLIKPEKHEFVAPASQKKLMGTAGYELWTFRVKPSGFVVPQQTSIRFIYQRPWETDDQSTQLFFKVTTQEKE